MKGNHVQIAKQHQEERESHGIWLQQRINLLSKLNW
jgi:hypothetical protein